MDVGKDLLDAQVVDRHGRMIGRVDDVVLQLRRGKPPRVLAMEVGLLAVAHRIHPRLGRIVRALAARWSPVSMRPVRLPLTLIRDIGVDIELAVDGEADRRLLRLEHWLRQHVVERIPWSGK